MLLLEERTVLQRLSPLLVVVFTLSMLVSSALLFLVEPMIAKMMLPMLGGTPAVWNTCLVFFQAVLFAGYLYAHGSLKWLTRRTQMAVHLALICLPLVLVGMLPLHLSATWIPPAQSTPVFWILGVLAVAVGLPFFVLSSSAPLMQRWFADSGHHQAHDPYFLYAASNIGSLAGLLAYPLLLEPMLRLSQQSRLWSVAYIGFVLMTIACASLVWKNRGTVNDRAVSKIQDEPLPQGVWKQRLRWIALAFVPSSLMLGVTTALTTDMPAIPLLWVLPLALYLVSFVMVFAKKPSISHAWLIQRLPFLMIAALLPVVSQTRFPLVVRLVLYLAALLGVALFCHGELAQSRPPVSRLTEFYLLMSLGGMLGGIFNSLLAPVLFHSVVEFPLVLIFAALLRPAVDAKPLKGTAAILTEAVVARKKVWAHRKDWLLPIALGICMLTIFLVLSHYKVKPSVSMNILIFGYSMLWCLSFGRRPLRFAAGLAAVVIASSFYVGPFGHVMETERSFFGVLRVANSADGKYRNLIHGGTLHGLQSLDASRSREPLAYYTHSGPAGQVMATLQANGKNAGDWAIVGLGAGAMACYLQPGETLTYYEIDPLVARIATDPRYFTFLQQCAPQSRIVLGDARLKIRDAADHQYRLIVLDAFSGDTIPMHLLTREALALYRSKLAPGGLLAFHISNNYLSLAPTLCDLAGDAHMTCMVEDDLDLTPAQSDAGKFASQWLVMAADPASLKNLPQAAGIGAHWRIVTERPNAKIWTDDYSNLLSVIKWR